MTTLLVIADKQGGKNIALTRAVALQQQTGAKITLLGCCYADIKNTADLKLAKLSRNQLEKKILARREQEMKKLVADLKIKKNAISIKTFWSKNIAQAITAYCKKHPVDMVIKSANRSESFLYTPTDWQLFRDCPTPVMITASKSWKKKTCIVAALDLSTRVKSKIKLNHNIMQQATRLAKALNQEVHIAFALSIPQALADMDLIDPKQYARDKRKNLQPTIDQFCEQYAIDSSCVHIRQGSPDKIIPSIASKLKADVVITGTVGRKGVKGKLIGNTVEGILTHLHTDIIAIKP